MNKSAENREIRQEYSDTFLTQNGQLRIFCLTIFFLAVEKAVMA